MYIVGNEDETFHVHKFARFTISRFLKDMRNCANVILRRFGDGGFSTCLRVLPEFCNRFGGNYKYKTFANSYLLSKHFL